MNTFASPWSAKERRLICEHQPYMRQWRQEAGGFQVVEPGDGPVSSLTRGTVNALGKIGVGATTIVDRTVDWGFNPNTPEPLRQGDLLPRGQRDTRALIDLVFSENTLKHPIGTVVSSGVRVFNIGTSLATDGIQKLGGGNN